MRMHPVDDRLHECGHALVSLLTEGAAPIDKITIIPRGDVRVQMACDVGAGLRGFPDGREGALLALEGAADGSNRCGDGRSSGGGGLLRVSLLLSLNRRKENVTTGASSDLQQATSIARALVYEWGLDKVGLAQRHEV